MKLPRASARQRGLQCPANESGENWQWKRQRELKPEGRLEARTVSGVAVAAAFPDPFLQRTTLLSNLPHPSIFTLKKNHFHLSYNLQQEGGALVIAV